LDAVLRIGGSILASPLKGALISDYSRIIRQLLSEGNRLGIVVGGGEIARQYISVAAELGLEDYQKDRFAISVSRLNAELISSALGEFKIARSISIAKSIFKNKGFVVMGGLRPGMTTDYVAFLLARALNADLILKATDQNGIYDKDPRYNVDAKLLKELNYSDLSKLIERASYTPGIHSILDPLTVSGLPGTNIKLIVFNGLIPSNLIDAVKGRNVGTLVAP